ncbi:hypothetical protein KHA94_16415 [Bacillus sp. FJAT-49705]|uniref:Uncharacterized protein n=1 Tax=Cytobacillus citreus TaxID=2833586 RepID=A0ABS5NVB9_9BACI|nr:hypothetical protein [Cytobacillus citreus]MBS4191775.1 hypothetical protein [Cytobacillus citreus]
MARNTVIQKAFEKGKQEGYQLGLNHGENRGIQKTVDFVAEKFAELQEMPGIGPKTLEKFRLAFGPEYFKEIE